MFDPSSLEAISSLTSTAHRQANDRRRRSAYYNNALDVSATLVFKKNIQERDYNAFERYSISFSLSFTTKIETVTAKQRTFLCKLRGNMLLTT
jgi:hypothetical protein